MRAVFEPLHVRLDPWPGEPDLEKNGLPRVYDLHLEKPTYRHVRGDEKQEDKSRALTPGVPGVLEFAAFQPQVVKLPTTASAPVLLPFVLPDQLAVAVKEFEAALAKMDEAAMKAAELQGDMIKAVFAADAKRGDKTLAQAAAKAQAAHQLVLAEIALTKAMKDTTSKDAEKNTKAAREAFKNAHIKAAKPGDTYASLPATLKAQEGPDESTNATVQQYPTTSTGRRLALARWIADQRNPLTARVLVNHVWMRHFGASLVPEMDDLGLRCAPPLHRDVLDTLSADFMAQGWSLKRLHRTMVLSDLYARSSTNAGADAKTMAADPDNAAYWRMNPRRMESQVVRDSLLQLAGRLDPAMGGPSIDPAKAETSPRRSLYFIQNADVEHRFLATFDNSNVLECYRRNESVVPQQALALTNSGLSRECAATLAAQMKALTEEQFITRSFRTVLGREPAEAERTASREGLAALNGSRSFFLQALLNHNDFVTLR